MSRREKYDHILPKRWQYLSESQGQGAKAANAEVKL